MQKIRYVQRVKIDGGVYLYFRKGNYREGPLHSPDDTEALRLEVEAILVRLAETAKGAKPREGTIGAMLTRYAGDGEKQKPCADFLGLAASTQGHYFRLATEMRLDYGTTQLGRFTGQRLSEMRDAWALRGHKATNDRVQVLKNALLPAIKDKRIPEDPFAHIEKMRAPHDRDEPNLAWTDAEVEAAIAWCLERGGAGLARAVALGRWAGFRRGTICLIPLGARVVRNLNGAPERRLLWLTEKRRVQCDKREDGRLTAVLDRTPNRALTIAYNADGGAWKPRQLNQALDRMVAALAKQGKARDMLTIHGLRHARGVELAEAGASDSQIMSQLEQATDHAAKIYRRQAARRQMADAAQDHIDNVVSLRAARRAKAD